MPYDIQEILYEYDGPLILTVKLAELQLLLYFHDHLEGATQYLASPVSDAIISDLKSGAKTLLEAISQPIMWVIDVTHHGEVLAAWRTSIDSIPEARLPKRHLMLWAHLEPLLRIRLSGPRLVPGTLPASVLKRGVDGAYAAVQTLIKLISSPRRGYPLADLTMQRLAFGSLELSFAVSPQFGRYGSDLDLDLGIDPRWEEIGGRFAQGLIWAEGTGVAPQLLGRYPDLVVLEAMNLLAPAPGDLFEKVEIAGRMFGDRRIFELDRDAQTSIRTAISEQHLLSMRATAPDSAGRPESFEGIIRRFDKDAAMFHLAVRGRRSRVRCHVPSMLLEEALAYFVSDISVLVVGQMTQATLEVERLERFQHLLNQ
jgi:hypothetical protein